MVGDRPSMGLYYFRDTEQHALRSPQRSIHAQHAFLHLSHAASTPAYRRRASTIPANSARQLRRSLSLPHRFRVLLDRFKISPFFRSQWLGPGK